MRRKNNKKYFIYVMYSNNHYCSTFSDNGKTEKTFQECRGCKILYILENMNMMQRKKTGNKRLNSRYF